jgi:hypothetical protein
VSGAIKKRKERYICRYELIDRLDQLETKSLAATKILAEQIRFVIT